MYLVPGYADLTPNERLQLELAIEDRLRDYGVTFATVQGAQVDLSDHCLELILLVITDFAVKYCYRCG